MTSPHTTIYTPFADGRPVRDIVEHTPALVNETWCRNLLRHTLDSLERQYATGAPQRPITPDTLVMLENGEALLLPADADTSASASASGLPADLHALALVVHYAITAELPPDGPLGPRLYENYSEQLTKGLDSCLGPNRRLRPQTVEDMRALLGIDATATEVLVPAAAEPAAPDSAAQPESQPEHAAASTGDNAPLGSEFAAPPVVAAPLDNPVPEPLSAAPVPTEPAIAPHETAEPASLREKTEAGMLRKPASQASPAANEPRIARAAEPIASPPAPVHDTVPPAEAAPRKPSAAIPVGAPRTGAAQTQPSRKRNGRVQRWGMIAGAAIVVLAAGGALVSYMQQNDARDLVPLTLPPGERAATGLDTGETVVPPAGSVAVDPSTGAIATDQPTGVQPADSPLDATTGAAPDALPGIAPGVAPGTTGAPQPPAAPAAAIINGTTYKLVIKPWGTLYVDDIDHGVSPPVKRLTLGPGRHTIRIVNPNFDEHIMTVDAGLRETAIIEHDFRAQAR